MGQVEGEVAIVTGGACGIGSACAATLAREGAKVVVTDLDESRNR
jgi:NAD(P)-dependent dehydrogenase (short-subunit alcohol dehydrogenase family)